jgi:hypothetical protein
MNILKRLPPFLLFVFIILPPYICQAADKGWKPYVKGDPFISSYDPGSVTRPSKDIVRVRVKDECTDKAKCREWHRKWIAESKGQMKSEYEHFAYRISSVEIQCKAGKIRYLSGRSVDENGKTIEEYNEPTTWLEVRNPWNQPNDPQEELWKILCK